MRFYGVRDIDRVPELQKLPEHIRFEMKVVSQVLPFRANNYVVEELIDWNKVYQGETDPIFNLTFMQKEMLSEEHFSQMADLLLKEAPGESIKKLADEIRLSLNPHPAGQKTANVPALEGEPVSGIQHKYRETCLVFPSSGQTCFAYCTFCFRWPQFVGMNDLKFATDESKRFQDYLKKHHEISDVLLTGGDPMIMSAKKLAAYIEPLLGPGYEHIQTIRIGTKVLSYWPYRFLTDKDSEDLLQLFKKVQDSGKHLAFMAHFNHWKELSTEAAQAAIQRLRETGLEIRTQSPLLRGINDSAQVWQKMWREQVRLGLVPYYMFVERDTGPRAFFEVPLAVALDIYKTAMKGLSGLARTARGPSMSAFPGKVSVDGITEINGEKVFVLSFLQGRNENWIKRPFFAKYDEKATWLDDLEPALIPEGQPKEFFFEREGPHAKL